MLHTRTYLPGFRSIVVLLVLPGLVSLSSPTLASSLTSWLAPTFSWAAGVSVFSTTTSCSIVPWFLNVMVVGPAFTDAGVTVRSYFPSDFSPPTTLTTVGPPLVAVVVTVTPPPAPWAPLVVLVELLELEHPVSATTTRPATTSGGSLWLLFIGLASLRDLYRHDHAARGPRPARLPPSLKMPGPYDWRDAGHVLRSAAPRLTLLTL